MRIKIVLSTILLSTVVPSFAATFFCPDPAELNKSPQYYFDVSGISGIKTNLGLARLRGITSVLQENPFGQFLGAREEQGTKTIICDYAGGITLLLPRVYRIDPNSKAWFRSLTGVICTPTSTEGVKTCPLVI